MMRFMVLKNHVHISFGYKNICTWSSRRLLKTTLYNSLYASPSLVPHHLFWLKLYYKFVSMQSCIPWIGILVNNIFLMWPSSWIHFKSWHLSSLKISNFPAEICWISMECQNWTKIARGIIFFPAKAEIPYFSNM